MTTSVLERPQSARRASADGPIRVAVIGCGAIARAYHLPVLAGHEGVRLAALVDRDVDGARELAREYRVESALADADGLSPESIDAAVIATPPSHHAPCCVELAGRGIHLLVEKPMAVTATDARRMTDAASRAGVVLAAGYFRRLFPAVRLLRAALDAGTLGRLVGFDVEEGDEYTWKLATLSNLRREQGGGGVLIDLGSHVLDLLLYLFPDEWSVLDYRDNALGGVETDCLLKLRLRHRGEPVNGRVELSRTRRLRSTLRVACEHGTLELRTGERFQLSIIPHGDRLRDAALHKDRPLRVQASWADEPEATGYEAYRAEIDDWLAAIRSGAQPLLSGESAARTVALIEECYQNASRLEEPWVWEQLSKPSPSSAPERNGHLAPAPARPKRVLITGASGFIGCRVAETLYLGKGWEVRALVHSPSSAARLARLPVEMVQGDLRSPEDVKRAVQGCDAVVHCAIGTAYGRRREIFAVTVGGTRTLLEAARATGVKRMVHLSSVSVHGLAVEGFIDERTPVRPTRGDDYSESKARAEGLVLRAARAGLPAVVLRPGNVYGPHSKTFSVRPIQYLKRGKLVLAGCAGDASNTVYIDNLVHAIVRALEAPAEAVAGEVFAVSDGDELTWGDFYGYFAEAVGAELHTTPTEQLSDRRGGGILGRLLGWPLGWWRSGVTILKSPEFRALGKRVLSTDPWGRFPRWLLGRFPALDRGVRKLVGTEAALVYRRPAPAPEDVMKVRPRGGVICVEKARKLLGYAPPVSRERALELTRDWIRHARIG
jgi:predicted dehydrogenase/nucleoside-diphosphate-sugar epimerase